MEYNPNCFPLGEFNAVQSLVEGNFSYEATTGNFIFQDGQSLPTKGEIKTELDKLQPIHSMKMLREERDKLLAETDWWAGSDLAMTQVREDYRQDLRDIPSGSEPILENGYITNVTWPTKPE